MKIEELLLEANKRAANLKCYGHHTKMEFKMSGDGKNILPVNACCPEMKKRMESFLSETQSDLGRTSTFRNF